MALIQWRTKQSDGGQKEGSPLSVLRTGTSSTVSIDRIAGSGYCAVKK